MSSNDKKTTDRPKRSLNESQIPVQKKPPAMPAVKPPKSKG